MSPRVLTQEHGRGLVGKLSLVEEAREIVVGSGPGCWHRTAQCTHFAESVEGEVDDFPGPPVNEAHRSQQRAGRPANPERRGEEVPARPLQWLEVAELFDGEHPSTVQDAFGHESIVGRATYAGEIGRNEARTSLRQPFRAFRREIGPVVEVVGVVQVEIVAGPENGGIARIQSIPGRLEHRGTDGKVTPPVPQVDHVRGADDAVKWNLLRRSALGIEAEGTVKVGTDVVCGQEHAAFPVLGVLVELAGCSVTQPHPEFGTQVFCGHALVERDREIDDAMIHWRVSSSC